MIRDPAGFEKRVLGRLLGPDAGHLLEIGCGDGRLSTELTDLSQEILAIDPDLDSLKAAGSLRSRGLRLVSGSGQSIPLPDESVNTVVFSLSLHHHPAPDRALIEAGRVLRSGGRILILEPDPRSPVNTLFRLIHDEDDAYEMAEDAIGRCGLETTEEDGYDTVWRFDGFDEMVDHLFAYFDQEPDQGRVDIMKELVGSRAGDHPLDMTDRTRYWLLKK